MGNCFGRSSSSKDDHFSTPGRTLGDAPAAQQQSSATIPAQIDRTKGRTLGSGPGGRTDEPKAAAARAAEVRTHHLSQPHPRNGPMVMTAFI